MQFLFGMMMIELVVKAGLWWARGWLWLAKWMLRTSWRAARLGAQQIRHVIETHRSHQAFRKSARQGKNYDGGN